MKIANSFCLTLSAAVWWVVLSATCYAQSTPSEFAELSLQELFELSIDDIHGQSQPGSTWNFAYNFKMVEFDGYLDGDNNQSREQVLFQGGGQLRTDKNFPVLPTIITQQVHVFSVGYQLSDDWRMHLSIPYLTQNTEHISIIENYANFAIDTSGVGDLVLSASHQLIATSENTWWFTAGLSLPTGSIDEQGDTPRAPGDQQLPYTMQLGSGTYDIPLEFSYQSLGRHDFSLAMSAVIRVGQNERNYRLGNSYSLGGRYKMSLSPSVQSFIGMELLHSQSIRGRDGELMVDPPFPYPASITNPKLYGGDKISAKLGVIWQFRPKYKLNVEFAKPLYQNLNGPQPKENYRSAVNISRVL